MFWPTTQWSLLFRLVKQTPQPVAMRSVWLIIFCVPSFRKKALPFSYPTNDSLPERFCLPSGGISENAPLVVADLCGLNWNVAYEIGRRQKLESQ